MKKSVLVAAVLTATAISGSAMAAVNPFKDLPEGHWAYDAVAMLAEDGVLDGYGDGTFQGGKTMNRYEMAEIVAKASEKYGTAALKDKGVLKKLEREFAAELKDMDVRLTAVESDVKEMKKGMSSFKWWGDARIRHIRNKNSVGVSGGSEAARSEIGTKSQNEMRIRLGLYGEPAENLSVTGQLKAENANIARSDYSHDHYAGKNDEKMSFNRLQLDWHAKNGYTLSAGRNEVKLGQGLIYWENPIDGIMVRKDFKQASLLLGAGDAAAATWSDKAEHAVFADLRVQVSPAVEVTAAYYNSHSDADSSVNYVETWDNGATWRNKWSKKNVRRNFQQTALGVNAQLAAKWNLIAEGVHNGADITRSQTIGIGGGGNADIADRNHRNGFWTRLTYGKLIWDKANTWNVYGEYFALGNLAIDSSGWPHRLNIAGGNGYGGAGARGFGLGVGYMLAPNTNFELTYYRLKPYDTGATAFDRYDDTGYASLTYSF